MNLKTKVHRIFGRIIRDREPHTASDTATIWGHATSADRLTVLGEVGQRLKTDNPDVRMVVSVNEQTGMDFIPEGIDDLLWLPAADTVGQARSFLRIISPACCIWTGGELRPGLIKVAQENGIRMILADLNASDVPETRRTWLTDQTLKMLESFGTILTPSKEAETRLRALGYPTKRIRSTTAMQTATSPAACNDDDLEDVTASLRGRPVWLAAHAEEAEFDLILSAHKQALRRLHRLLLIVAVKDANSVPALCARLKELGMSSATWEEGEVSEETTQVMLSTSEEALGLWYRVSPVTLVAGSLFPELEGNNPMQALSLGSAVMFGPGHAAFADTYTRLVQDDAAVEITQPNQLAAEIARLSAPDQAASMALRGWQIATESAHLAEQISSLVSKNLPFAGDNDARS